MVEKWSRNGGENCREMIEGWSRNGREIPGYPERKRVLRLLDQSSRARISVFGVWSLVGGLRSVSVGALSADHVCSENEKCQNKYEAY